MNNYLNGQESMGQNNALLILETFIALIGLSIFLFSARHSWYKKYSSNALTQLNAQSLRYQQ